MHLQVKRGTACHEHAVIHSHIALIWMLCTGTTFTSFKHLGIKLINVIHCEICIKAFEKAPSSWIQRNMKG